MHEHKAAADWSSDESFHWHACEGCEELLDKAEHSFTWTVTEPAAPGVAGKEEGVCSVCGKTLTREIPAPEPETAGFDSTMGISENGFRNIVLGIFGAMGVGTVALFVGAIVHGVRSRKRR